MKERDIALFFSGFCGAVVLGILAIAVALSCTGCASSRPVAVAPDSLAASPATLASLPAYLVPAPVGSTPRQRRQWQRAQAQNLARAGVLPAKVKNSSVAAAVGPGAVATSTNTPAGSSWWWYVLAAVVGAVGWEVLTTQVTPLRLLLRWRL